MSKRNIYLVAASEMQKRDKTAREAKDLYNSPMFCACREFVEAIEADWLILSEMHGLIWPYTMLAAYNPKHLSDDEKMHRIERAISGDVIANTLISSLELTYPGEITSAEWRRQILNETKFTLLGDADFLDLAMTELTIAGVEVESKRIPA